MAQFATVYKKRRRAQAIKARWKAANLTEAERRIQSEHSKRGVNLSISEIRRLASTSSC